MLGIVKMPSYFTYFLPGEYKGKGGVQNAQQRVRSKTLQPLSGQFPVSLGSTIFLFACSFIVFFSSDPLSVFPFRHLQWDLFLLRASIFFCPWFSLEISSMLIMGFFTVCRSVYLQQYSAPFRTKFVKPKYNFRTPLTGFG